WLDAGPAPTLRRGIPDRFQPTLRIMCVHLPGRMDRDRESRGGTSVLRVRDIMTTNVITLSPQTSLLSAVQLFADSQVTGAPVVEGSKVVGVLSVSDLLEFSGSAAAPELGAGEGIEPEDWATRVGREDVESED